ncbi:hypothetical protein L6Q21_08090 [Sandaracinobacter sp. RS1-74]|uniref:hypothetical protein n=1 Tax=Sandaracinobacteroides sayramensis TaxID=2913411 RepID=UPI001EDC85B0|nr:hypothetical protein [Sandaracinobacteroides sayramensis]MCG2840939.1 hypothetical protein [Sandaracinobacteroides sayramensis]
MMPTSQQMLAAMQLALKEHVTPLVDDQWAQSALRSVDVILNHLQVRVAEEGPMLHADTSELLELLRAAGTRAGYADAALHDFLAEAPATLAGYARVDALQALNHRGREIVDRLLLHCDAQRADAGVAGLHADLRAYLLRHADRESGFFFPTYVGRPV